MNLKDKRYIFVGNGPQNDFWRSQYLLCPYCKVLLEKGSKVSHCKCNNITIDGEYLKICVKVDESEIPTFNEAKSTEINTETFEQITNKKYETKIKPKSTFIDKIDLIGTKDILILENYCNYCGESNLYLIKRNKEIYMDLPGHKDFYVNFSHFGQPFLEATSLNGVQCKINLKNGQCFERYPSTSTEKKPIR